MAFVDRLVALTNAIATAVNARAGRVGASAYDIAVTNGYTGTQTQWNAQPNRAPQVDNFIWWFEPNAYSISAGTGSGAAATVVVAGSTAIYSGLICRGSYLQNSSAVTLATPAPASNGQWYYVYVDVVWTNGVAGATPKVVAGTATGNTTVPTSVPTTFPQALINTPGTRVTVPLMYYWIATGATVGTAFDLRLLTNTSGKLTVANLHALYTASSVLATGAEVRVLPYTSVSGEGHIDSLWVKAGTAIYNRGRISGGSTLALRNDIDALVAAYGFNYTSSPNGGDVSIYYDASTNWEWARSSGGWYLLYGDSAPATLTFSGTTAFQNGDATGFHQLRKTPGGKITWSFYMNIGSTVPSVGSTLVTLPVNFRPQRTTAITASQWNNTNWKGNVSMEMSGTGVVQFRYSSSTLTANDGIFGTIDFVSA